MEAALTEAGVVVFTDTTDPTAGPEGDGVVFSIPLGNMVDSASPEPAFSDAVDYALEATGPGAWVLRATPDMAWLAAPERVYPVLVDPSVNIGVVRDCWVQSGAPTTSRCGDNARSIFAGRAAGATHRSLLDFDLSEIPAPAEIGDADVRLNLDSTQTTSPGISAQYAMYRAGKVWDTTATWASSGANGAWTGGDPVNAGGSGYGTQVIDGTTSGDYLFDVTEVVKGWRAGGFDNTGLVLKQVGESTGNRLAFFSSSNQNAGGKRPKLEVTYTEGAQGAAQSGDRSFFDYITRDLSDKISVKANIGTGNLLVAAQDANLPGVAGFDLPLTRYYNSLAESWGGAKMGVGWSTSLGGSVRLEFPSGLRTGSNTERANEVDFYGASGYRTRFNAPVAVPNKPGQWSYVRPAPGLTADLVFDDRNDAIQANDIYELTWFDQAVYEFDADGRLSKMRDANDNTITFAYNDAGDLTYAIDTRNRAVTLAYNAGGLVEAIQVRRPDGSGGATGTVMLQWSYTYTDTVPAKLASSALTRVDEAAIGGTTPTVSGQDTTGNVGAQTTYTYDAADNLSQIANARENQNASQGSRMSFAYRSGRLDSLTQHNDTGTKADGELVGDSITTFAYRDTNDLPPRVAGRYVSDEDAFTSICRSEDRTEGPDNPNPATSFAIVDGAQVGDQDTWEYCVDDLGRVRRTTDPNNRKRAKTFTPNSNVATADLTGLGSAAGQYEMSYTDDNPDETTSPEGARTTAEYNDTENPHSVTATKGDDSHGESANWSYVYDNDNNLIQANSQADTAADNPRVEYWYCWTLQGQIDRIDPITPAPGGGGTPGSTTGHSTNPVKDTTDSQGNEVADRCRNQSSQGNDTLFTYSGAPERHLTSVDRPKGGDLTYTYDNLSRIKTVTQNRYTNGDDVEISYTYDALDHVTKVTHQRITTTGANVGNPVITRYSYDLAGNRTVVDDNNPATGTGTGTGDNTFTFDELNRLTAENTGGNGPSPATEYYYDIAGNLATTRVTGQSISGDAATDTTYTYDKLNLVKTLDLPGGGGVVEFGYDNHDRRKTTTFPDAAGSTTGGNAVVEKTHRDNDGNPVCIYSYRLSNPVDDENDLTSGCPDPGLGKLLDYRGYKYLNTKLSDDPGTEKDERRTSTIYDMVELGGARTTYEYDDIKRLETALTKNAANTSTLRDHAYVYDRHSNLIEDKTTGTTPGLETGRLWMAYNDGDEICATQRLAPAATDPGLGCGSGNPVDATVYTHDDAGNLETATGGSTDTLAGLELGYNLPGQTTSITAPGAITAAPQAYDALMQDRRTRSGDTTMSYGFAGLSAQQTTGASGAHGELFVRDPDGKLIAMIDTTTGDTRYYLTDHQDSVTATVDHDGGDPVRYLYEPYGQQIRTWTDTNNGDGNNGSENTSMTAPAVDNNPWRYASGYYNDDTGFLKFGTRYYIPQLTTWTQPDPEEGDIGTPLTLNRSLYSGCDPVNKSDASGRSWSEVGDFASLMAGCAGATLFFYEASLATGAFQAASVFGGPLGAGLYAGIGGIGACLFGMLSAEYSFDSIFDVPIF